MLLSEARADLAKAQARLAAGLVRGTPAPEFDAARLQAAAVALLAKRRREVRLAWPNLAGALGERFEMHFTAYAGRTPLPAHGGPLADGRAFARYLQQHGELPQPGRIEVLRCDLHYASTSTGLLPRRGPVLRTALLRCPRRLVLALHFPWLGERWLWLRLA
jgi:hypothetical protein